MLKKQHILTLIACVGISMPKTIFSASTEGSEYLGRDLLQATPENESIHQETAFLTAIVKGQNDIVEQLLAAGADANMTFFTPTNNTASENCDNSLLLYVLKKNQLEIMASLLRAGADPNIQGLLFNACIFNGQNAARLLLNYGSNPLDETKLKLLKEKPFTFCISDEKMRQMQTQIAHIRRQALGQLCAYMDEVHNVPLDVQRLILRDFLDIVPEQMPFK